MFAHGATLALCVALLGLLGGGTSRLVGLVVAGIGGGGFFGGWGLLAGSLFALLCSLASTILGAGGAVFALFGVAGAITAGPDAETKLAAFIAFAGAIFGAGGAIFVVFFATLAISADFGLDTGAIAAGFACGAGTILLAGYAILLGIGLTGAISTLIGGDTFLLGRVADLSRRAGAVFFTRGAGLAVVRLADAVATDVGRSCTHPFAVVVEFACASCATLALRKAVAMFSKVPRGAAETTSSAKIGAFAILDTNAFVFGG